MIFGLGLQWSLTVRPLLGLGLDSIWASDFSSSNVSESNSQSSCVAYPAADLGARWDGATDDCIGTEKHEQDMFRSESRADKTASNGLPTSSDRGNLNKRFLFSHGSYQGFFTTAAQVTTSGYFIESTSQTLTSLTLPALGSSTLEAISTASPTPNSFVTTAIPTQTSGVSVSTPGTSSLPTIDGKKGLAYNIASLTDAFAGTGMAWAYNWASIPNGNILSGIEYVPMLWGEDGISGWTSAALSAVSAGSTHLLSFNEPDLSSQANLSPSSAANLHIAYMNPLSGYAQIGSPAVTNGVGLLSPVGVAWLQEFFLVCAGGCDVDFVAFHYYNDASSIADFESHVVEVITLAALNGVSKVWLTEFGVTGADADVENFLSSAMSFLDSQAAVERYAYFMCGNGTLLNQSSLSPLGLIYAA